MISLLTCHKKSTGRKGIRYGLTSELKGILTRMDARIQSLYSELPTNAMLVICTGHGDTAIVQRYMLILLYWALSVSMLFSVLPFFFSFIAIEVVPFLKPTIKRLLSHIFSSTVLGLYVL